MNSLPIFLLLSGCAAVVLALFYAAFELCIYLLYKASGGRLTLAAYLKKL